MLSVVLVGTGNVAEHLFHAFEDNEAVNVLAVMGRNALQQHPFGEKFLRHTNYENLPQADVYLLAVSDSAIAEVSERLSSDQRFLVHVSGATPMERIAGERKGVFYPLQTFTKGKTLDFKDIPILVEASSSELQTLLLELGKNISQTVQVVSSKKREKLHLAAVFANNFVNHLFAISETICAMQDVTFDLLKPLIYETAHKLEILTPKQAQTGPAKRGDMETMKKHLSQLNDNQTKDLYTLISQAIQNYHEKEL
ncbi:MAG: DUF2520 domain-containing protein [Bacteroidota bacterium]